MEIKLYVWSTDMPVSDRCVINHELWCRLSSHCITNKFTYFIVMTDLLTLNDEQFCTCLNKFTPNLILREHTDRVWENRKGNGVIAFSMLLNYRDRSLWCSHRSDSNQGSEYFVVFVSLISGSGGENFKIWSHRSVENSCFHLN